MDPFTPSFTPPPFRGPTLCPALSSILSVVHLSLKILSDHAFWR